MSGGGGGGGAWRPEVKPSPGPSTGAGGGTVTTPPAPCNIVETAVLNSPDRTVLASLRPGDVLDVVFLPGPPQRLVAQASQGIAGSITSTSMPQIIQCMTQGGYSYVADVMTVHGGICQVHIHPR